MCDKVTTPTRPFLPGAPSQRVYVLLDEVPRQSLDSADLYDLIDYCTESDISWLPQQLRSTAPTNRREWIESLRYVVVDLDFAIAGRTYDVDEILDRLDKLGLPSPAAIISTGGGYHVYWSLGSLYIGPRPNDEPWQTQNRQGYWCAYYETVTDGLCSALGALGADRQATSASHLFRLPGSYNPKRNLQTYIAHADWETQTTLKELRSALVSIAKEDGFTLKDPAEEKARAYNIAPRCRAQDTPPIRWLLENEMIDGERNSATFAIAQAYLFDEGADEEEEILRKVLEWNEAYCEPVQPLSDVAPVVASCARRHRAGKPLGLSPERLMQIKNVHGQMMDRKTASAIFEGLPGKARCSECKRKRKHRKRRDNSERILENAIDLIEAGVICGMQTDEAVAKKLRASASTFKKSVKPSLKEQGYCTTDLNSVPRRTIYAPPTGRATLSTTYRTDCTKEDPYLDQLFEAIGEGILYEGAAQEPGQLAAAQSASPQVGRQELLP